ncbi:YvrJ family protein [Sporolactobacillus shoreicorticis]|uniref:YvrJ family protein n=1 Tax=Sporolactobacillus shoreicorticis TaxID=1923877 RepID=A0ABW5RZK1_9BACL|nr:YvrJ family protein [Sporolactobacillus shoreicorticis]MCO7128092.1 YvrJ family protein [Sporolactobacillus shoreicorticis]
MEVWLSMVKDVGFPAVVTFFLLHRIEGKLDELIQSIRLLPVDQEADQRDELLKKQI